MMLILTWLESTRVARSRAVQPDFDLTVGSAPASSKAVTTSVCPQKVAFHQSFYKNQIFGQNLLFQINILLCDHLHQASPACRFVLVVQLSTKVYQKLKFKQDDNADQKLDFETFRIRNSTQLVILNPKNQNKKSGPNGPLEFQSNDIFRYTWTRGR